MLKFKKMHGLGNDFVIIDQRDGGAALTPEQIKAIGNRKRGVGFDQLVTLSPSDKADLFMTIYNADGSEAGACGNVTRCVGHLYMSEQGAERCTIETVSGILHCTLAGDLMVAVDMGAPSFPSPTTLSASAEAQASLPSPVGRGRGPCAAWEGEGFIVDVGNPHCVFFVDDVNTTPVETIGPQIEHHEAFPNRTNVEFVQALSDDKLRMRVWERGCGITEACGTGACATIVAAVTQGKAARKAEIILDGGSLFLEWRKSDGHILMTGPVAYAFEGIIDESPLNSL